MTLGLLDRPPRVLATLKSTLLFLRWVVIVTASYLVLFAPTVDRSDPRALLFVAVFLATNLVATAFPEPWFEGAWLRAAVLLFDTAWISLGMLLAGEVAPELFLLYFSVLFVAALGESEAMIAGGSIVIGLLHLAFLLRTEPAEAILSPGVLLRFPFLFGIATFYGYLVAVAKRERRAADLARERGRARTDFLATLTHDLRSPLSAIVSLVGLLLEDPEAVDLSPAERRRLLQDVRRAAASGLEIVGSFLALASSEARTKAGRREPVDLVSLVGHALRDHRISAAEKGVRLVEKFEPGLPAVPGDPVQLGRALSNLLSNAIKFTDSGGTVELAGTCDGEDVELAVSDEGPGVSETVRRELFQPYVSESDRVTGTGLGLFIVRLVAEAHGGSVRLVPKQGRGARFVLRLPSRLTTRSATSSIRR